MHGLAGSGALTALVVTTLPSTVTRLGYLALFGVGTTVGMAALSGLLGWPLARLGTNGGVARALAIAVGSVSTVLGLLWSVPAHRAVVLNTFLLTLGRLQIELTRPRSTAAEYRWLHAPATKFQAFWDRVVTDL